MSDCFYLLPGKLDMKVASIVKRAVGHGFAPNLRLVKIFLRNTLKVHGSFQAGDEAFTCAAIRR